MTIVRENLMSQPGYTPYCGVAQNCLLGMPRTQFIRDQFECGCGWRSNFPADLIAEYKAKWSIKQEAARAVKTVRTGQALCLAPYSCILTSRHLEYAQNATKGSETLG